MGMKLTVGGVVRDFALDSNWMVTQEKDINRKQSLGFEFGAQAWVIGKANISVSSTPHFQITIGNHLKPTAGQIEYAGDYLPQWERRYLLDIHQAQIEGAIGASAQLPIPVSFTGNVTKSLREDHLFSPIFRLNGAPVARDAKHTYVAGDPTGLLGLALTGSVGVGGSGGPVSTGGSLRITLMNSNYQRVLHDASSGKWREAGGRLLSTLFHNNHLQFAYAVGQASWDTDMVIGTDNFQAGGGVKATFGWSFIRAMHLLVKNPSTKRWQYVYTRHIQPNAKVSPPHRPASAPPWTQPKGKGPLPKAAAR